MSLIKKLVNKPSQVIRLFVNTTKKDGSSLDEINHNLRGRIGEYTLSVYPNRERMYLEVSRPSYEGGPWLKGYISLSFHSSRTEGGVEISVGVLELPVGPCLKVELRDEEAHARRDSEETYKAYTLCIFGGSLGLQDLEEAIRLSQDKKTGEEPQAVLPTPAEGAITKKTGEDIPF